MEIIQSMLESIMTRDDRNSLLASVNIKFDNDTSRANIIGNIDNILSGGPDFKYELCPRYWFIFADIVNWFKSEEYYNKFEDWLYYVIDKIRVNKPPISEEHDLTVSFTTDGNSAKIIYLATLKQSHLIFYSKETVSVKITYDLRKGGLTYTIYTDNIYERIAYKSYMLNIMDQMYNDNLTRVICPFEKDIHFTSHLNPDNESKIKRNIDVSTNVFASTILDILKADTYEFKVKNKTKTTLNEIDKSTIIEFLNFYLSRYLYDSEDFDIVYQMDRKLPYYNSIVTFDQVYNYKIGDTRSYYTLSIKMDKDRNTKTVNKIMLTFREHNKQNVTSSLLFELLNNKLRVTLHDRDLQDEELKNIDILYKLVGKELEVKESGDDQNLQINNNIKEILQIITGLKGQDKPLKDIKVFTDVKAANRGIRYTNRKPTEEIYTDTNNLIEINHDQLVYELSQLFEIKDISSKTIETLVSEYNRQKEPVEFKTVWHRIDWDGPFFGAFFEESYNYAYVMLEEGSILFAFYYDKNANRLIYTIDLPAMSMVVKLKQHLLEAEKTKDKVTQHKDSNYYDINEYDITESEHLSLPTPYTNQLIDFIYTNYNPLYTVVCLDKAITDKDNNFDKHNDIYDCYDIDNRQMPDVINTALNRLSKYHQLDKLEEIISNVIYYFKGEDKYSNTISMSGNEIEIALSRNGIQNIYGETKVPCMDVEVFRYGANCIHHILDLTLVKINDTLVIKFNYSTDHQDYIYETLKPILLTYNPIQQLNKDLTPAKIDSTKPLKSILAEYIPTDCIELTYLYNKSTIILTQKNTDTRMPFKFEGLQLRHFFVEILQWYYIDYDNNKDFHEMSIITDTVNRLLNKEDKLIGFSNDKVSYLFNPSPEGSTIIIEASNDKMYEKLLKAFKIIKTLPSKKITQTVSPEDTSTDKEDKTSLTPISMWKSKH